ncbi:MAG: hypothetical protein JNL98_43855, partial [Bryobacterales bacterium]|nr:hypothetical protein [Bryobacterales bacterium]
AAAEQARAVTVREPRPAGFPLLFTRHWQLIEPAVAFLHEHSVQRAHTDDTLRTYAEILYDWFETLEQNDIPWHQADAVDLVAYRNRMMTRPSPHTGRAYRTTTINHRVRGVLRFYVWAVRAHWLNESPLADKTRDFAVSRRYSPIRTRYAADTERSIFVLRQYEPLPRPLVSGQARELLAYLAPPYDL